MQYHDDVPAAGEGPHVAWSPRDVLALTCERHSNRQIHLVNPRRPRELKILQPQGAHRITVLKWSVSGTSLLVGDEGGVIKTWSRTLGKDETWHEQCLAVAAHNEPILGMFPFDRSIARCSVNVYKEPDSGADNRTYSYDSTLNNRGNVGFGDLDSGVISITKNAEVLISSLDDTDAIASRASLSHSHKKICAVTVILLPQNQARIAFVSDGDRTVVNITDVAWLDNGTIGVRRKGSAVLTRITTPVNSTSNGNNNSNSNGNGKTPISMATPITTTSSSASSAINTIGCTDDTRNGSVPVLCFSESTPVRLFVATTSKTNAALTSSSVHIFTHSETELVLNPGLKKRVPSTTTQATPMVTAWQCTHVVPISTLLTEMSFSVDFDCICLTVGAGATLEMIYCTELNQTAKKEPPHSRAQVKATSVPLLQLLCPPEVKDQAKNKRQRLSPPAYTFAYSPNGACCVRLCSNGNLSIYSLPGPEMILFRVGQVRATTRATFARAFEGIIARGTGTWDVVATFRTLMAQKQTMAIGKDPETVVQNTVLELSSRWEKLDTSEQTQYSQRLLHICADMLSWYPALVPAAQFHRALQCVEIAHSVVLECISFERFNDTATTVPGTKKNALSAPVLDQTSVPKKLKANLSWGKVWPGSKPPDINQLMDNPEKTIQALWQAAGIKTSTTEPRSRANFSGLTRCIITPALKEKFDVVAKWTHDCSLHLLRLLNEINENPDCRQLCTSGPANIRQTLSHFAILLALIAACLEPVKTTDADNDHYLSICRVFLAVFDCSSEETVVVDDELLMKEFLDKLAKHTRIQSMLQVFYSPSEFTLVPIIYEEPDIFNSAVGSRFTFDLAIQQQQQQQQQQHQQQQHQQHQHQLLVSPERLAANTPHLSRESWMESALSILQHHYVKI